jgi:DNA-directed RNA polymerase specialized sigma24 family protein
MSQHPSITFWISQLKTGDVEAAQRLWELYFLRMVELARRKLEGVPKAVADEEDVALSAFRSFCSGARQGRFSQLVDRDNLWPLLMAITANKSVDLIRRQNRQKRGGTGHADRERDAAKPPKHEADFDQLPGRSPVEIPLSELICVEPTPEFAAELSDQLQHLLQRLDETGDSDLRKIALMKMECYSTPEIAEAIGCASRSVERKMQIVMRLWGKNLDP